VGDAWAGIWCSYDRGAFVAGKGSFLRFAAWRKAQQEEFFDRVEGLRAGLYHTIELYGPHQRWYGGFIAEELDTSDCYQWGC
jgi:hypothetical protein